MSGFAAGRRRRALALAAAALGAAAAAGDTFRVACVGDSITQGAGLADPPRQSYPSRLQDLLGSCAEVRNFGHGGRALLRRADHPYVREAAYADALAFEPQAVLLMLGVNDTRDANWRFAAEFRRDALALVRAFQASRCRPSILILLSPPVFAPRYGLDPDRLRDGVLPRWCEIAADERLPVVDLHRLFDGYPERFPDAVHPDAAGALAMAMRAYEALTAPEGPWPLPPPPDPFPAPRVNLRAALAGDDWLALHRRRCAEARAAPSLLLLGDGLVDDRTADLSGLRRAVPRVVSMGVAGDDAGHIRWRLLHGALAGPAPSRIVLSVPVDAMEPDRAAAALRALIGDVRRAAPSSRVAALAPVTNGDLPAPASRAAMRRVAVEQGVAWIESDGVGGAWTDAVLAWMADGGVDGGVRRDAAP